MIGITDRAKCVLLDLRASIADEKPNAALRLAMNGNCELEISIDVEKAGDVAVQHDGATLLLIEDTVSVGLAGSTIDCTPDGGLRLTLSSRGHDNGA
jgi:hypothetical protein